MLENSSEEQSFDSSSENNHSIDYKPAHSSTELSRRKFLARTGLGIVALQSAGLLAQTALAQGSGTTNQPKAVARPMPKLEDELPQPENQKVGFAVVGLGNFALNQIMPSFAESKKARLVALVSGDADKAQRIATQYGVDKKSLYNYSNFEQLRDNKEVQVVYIILPNGLHAEYTIRAARIGKHIMCEKPMAPTVAECRQMIEACRSANRRLMIAYRAQYEPFNLEAIRIAKSKEFGTIKTIVADHGRNIDPTIPSDQWRLKKALAGGGSLYDIGIYSLQATRYITGEEPIEIAAMVHSPPNDPRFAEVEETVHWTMRFRSGVLANCTSSYGYHDVKRYRVFAEKGWFDLDPATDYYKHRLTVGHDAPQGSAAKGIQEERQIQEGNQFAAGLDHMAECVQMNKNPKTPGEEGLQDVRLMSAIYEAARTGHSVKL